VVRTAGLEPAWGCPLRILSPVCLPVSPRPHGRRYSRSHACGQVCAAIRGLVLRRRRGCGARGSSGGGRGGKWTDLRGVRALRARACARSPRSDLSPVGFGCGMMRLPRVTGRVPNVGVRLSLTIRGSQSDHLARAVARPAEPRCWARMRRVGRLEPINVVSGQRVSNAPLLFYRKPSSVMAAAGRSLLGRHINP
jgi:hypothetical protein